LSLYLLLWPISSTSALHWTWLSSQEQPTLDWNLELDLPSIPAAYRFQIEREQDCSRHGLELRGGGRGRVVDTLLFSSELDILEARLHELYEWVDLIVIVEIGITYQGAPRNSTLASCLRLDNCLARFWPLLDKVHYTFVESLPNCGVGDAWACESQHRELLLHGFLNAGGLDEDMVIVSDADEFARASTAWTLANCEVPDRMHIETDFCYFSAHCRVKGGDLRLKAVRGGLLKELGPQAIRLHKPHGLGQSWTILRDGGFHFSYFMSPAEMVDKIESFAHGEFNRFPFNTEMWLWDNARMCTFSVDWVHVPAVYIPTADLVYPRV
ncbi:unnamed protein product, partial [Polarella glacialis]